MPTRIRLRIVAAVILLIALAPPCYADGPKLGLTLSVEGDGFLNPVVIKVSVTQVEKASLADSAGIVAGDEIVQIEGRSVAGSHGDELRSLMKLDDGKTRTLRLKHADGKQSEVKLTKPKE